VRITTDGSRLYTLDYNMASDWGGCLCALSGSDIEIEGRVQIIGNEAEYGGGICLLENSECFMSDTNGWGPLLALNTAALDGGGAYAKDPGTHLVMYNTTVGYQQGGNVSLRDLGNGGGGGVAVIDDAQLLATNVRFEDNRCSRAGGGLYVYNAYASVDSEVSALSGGIYPQSAFVGNAATNPSVLTFGQGGGAYVEEDGVLNLSHVVLAGNHSHYGSALASAQNGLCTAWNCLIAQNHTTGAGAIWVFAATNTCLDCTIADNGPSGVVNTGDPSQTLLGSSIVWGHSGSQVTAGQTVYSSAVQGGYPGSGNISNYPVFADTNMIDYQLDVSSPCIDTGFGFWYITNDIIGTARPYGSEPDMGCYEFVPEPAAMAALAIAIAAVIRAHGARS
jgi:hypothetical protein